MRNKVDTDREKSLLAEIRRLEIVTTLLSLAHQKIIKRTNQSQKSSQTWLTARRNILIGKNAWRIIHETRTKSLLQAAVSEQSS